MRAGHSDQLVYAFSIILSLGNSCNLPRAQTSSLGFLMSSGCLRLKGDLLGVTLSPSMVVMISDSGAIIFRLQIPALSTASSMLLLRPSRLCHVRLCTTPQTAANQAPPPLGFSRKEYWSGLPFPSSVHACILSRFSHVWLCAILWTAAHQAPPSTGFSRQEYWSGLPFPSLQGLWPQVNCCTSYSIPQRLRAVSEAAQSCQTLCGPMDWSLPGSSDLGIFQARILEWLPFPSPVRKIKWKHCLPQRKPCVSK